MVSLEKPLSATQSRWYWESVGYIGVGLGVRQKFYSTFRHGSLLSDLVDSYAYVNPFWHDAAMGKNGRGNEGHLWAS